ncbi:hypothetical protein Bca52824_016160 [Brassica carinata]|uniref:Uncharacterized protein n=1 Tax=Brassica carinata TaxID=52824 RepID=A0A8X8B6C4_BRACI|nr:hypothetical protein Bca52824_016160 [Brassica carinata]
MEDLLEPEDRKQLGDLDSSREVPTEYLELEDEEQPENLGHDLEMSLICTFRKRIRKLHQRYAVASQRGFIVRSDVYPTKAVLNDINKPASIDTTSSSSIDAHRL